jgi:ribokinase
MMKDSFVTQQKVLSYAKKKGIKIVFNPSLYVVTNASKQFRKMLKYVDIIIFNREEAQALLNNVTDNMFTLLFEISKLGPKIVVITDGHHGAHCYNAIEQCVYSAKPEKVEVVETTGAGDALASGFIAGFIMGKDIGTSLKIGMLNAESVIAHLGSKNILLGRKAYDMADNDTRTIFKKKL